MNNTSRGELSSLVGHTWIYVVLVAVLALAGCGPDHTPECPAGCSSISAGLDGCDPELGCPGGPGEPPPEATLSVTLTNASTAPMHFTLGASVMDDARTTVYASAVPLSGAVLNAGETRAFATLLSASPGLIFVTEAVGYDTTIAGSNARMEPVIATTAGAHSCTFTYTLYDVGRMSADCH